MPSACGPIRGSSRCTSTSSSDTGTPAGRRQAPCRRPVGAVPTTPRDAPWRVISPSSRATCCWRGTSRRRARGSIWPSAAFAIRRAPTNGCSSSPPTSRPAWRSASWRSCCSRRCSRLPIPMPRWQGSAATRPSAFPRARSSAICRTTRARCRFSRGWWVRHRSSARSCSAIPSTSTGCRASWTARRRIRWTTGRGRCAAGAGQGGAAPARFPQALPAPRDPAHRRPRSARQGHAAVDHRAALRPGRRRHRRRPADCAARPRGERGRRAARVVRRHRARPAGRPRARLRPGHRPAVRLRTRGAGRRARPGPLPAARAGADGHPH